jgi:hypothetical protein
MGGGIGTVLGLAGGVAAGVATGGLAGIAVGSSIAGMGMQLDAAANQQSYYDAAQASSQAAAQAYLGQIPYIQANRAAQAEAYRQEAAALERNAIMGMREAELNDYVKEINSLSAKTKALRIRREASYAIQQIARESEAVQGAQVAGYLKSGVFLSGTPALVIEDSISRAEEDMARMLEAADWDAEQVLTQATLDGISTDVASAHALAGSYDALMQADLTRKQADLTLSMAELETYQAKVQAYTAQLQGYQAGVQSTTSMLNAGAGLLAGGSDLAYRMGSLGGKKSTGSG